MVVPDIELICEIMLVAEGFIDARLLARKFITLCSLCRELLSIQVRVSLGFWVWYMLISTYLIGNSACWTLYNYGGWRVCI